MKKILKDPTYKNTTGYNGLDLSSIQNFSSSCGHIIPVTWDFLQPGDKVKVGELLRTRTTPLISASYAEIKEHVRWFFVPMNQIYKPFGDLFHGIQDLPSDFYTTIIDSPARVNNLLPSISLGDLIVNVLIEPLKTGSQNPSDEFFRRARLLECMGIPVQRILTYNFAEPGLDTWKQHKVNLLPFLAYQKIWFDYFRDSDRFANDPLAYNLDSWIDVQSQTLTQARLNKIFKLQNCPLYRDTMNNLLVSPLFGEQGVGGISVGTLSKVNNWLTDQEPFVKNQTRGNTTTPTQVSIGNVTSAAYVSTATIRSAFAVDKLLEITRRAKKHFDAQTLAHFGVEVPMGLDGECIDIHHHESSLIIGDVVSSADTEGAPLGEIAGKGYNSDTSRDSSFEAKSHGVLMCVYYSKPVINYLQQGIDKKFLYTLVSDFPREEFENLGNQPVFLLNQQLNPEQVNNSQIQGWQYRYQEVKSQFNRVITGLARGLSSWCVNRGQYYKNADDFYCQPTQINNLLVQPYFEDIVAQVADPFYTAIDLNTSLFDSDPLVHQLKLNYRKATKLSTYGISQI